MVLPVQQFNDNFKDLLESISSSMKDYREGQLFPEKLRQEQYTTQQAKLKSENPLLGMPGMAGQLGAEIYLNNLNKIKQQNQPQRMEKDNQQQQMGQQQSQEQQQRQQQLGGKSDQNQPDEDFMNKVIRQLHDYNQAQLNSKITDSNLKAKQAKGYAWAHMTAETKNELVAQGLGMKIDPMQMQDYINKGLNLKQIAVKEGLDPENLPPPIRPPTTATKTRVQQVQQVVPELEYLSSYTSARIRPYADTYNLPLLGTFSPQAIKDQFGTNDQQKRYGRFIGAMALQTGIATGRALAEGTNRPGVDIMREVRDKSLAGISKLSPIHMTPVMMDEAQKTITEALTKGTQIRTMVGMSPFNQNLNVGLQQSENEKETPKKKYDFSGMSTEELRKISGGQ